jgi:phosphoribosylglycinamide formyltransferase 1
MNREPINLAVLLSGSGTTLQNLIDHIRAGSLNAKITAIIASRTGIKGIDRAREASLPLHLIERTKYRDIPTFSRDIFKVCTDAKVELICLGGWLSLLEIPAAFDGKMMNIHPALLPSFGGKGMYGQRVHQAVLDHGCKITGCTVHFVDRVYDNGPIILQRTCPVMETDTPDSLAHRVFEEEKIAYPQAIELFQENKLRIEGRRVRIV